MALQRGKLAGIQTISDSAASIYANPSSTKSYIRSLILHNTDSAAQSVTLYNVPDSGGSLGTPAAGNQFFEQSMAAGETVIMDLQYPIVLTDENDALFAVAGTASVITVQLMGDTDA